MILDIFTKTKIIFKFYTIKINYVVKIFIIIYFGVIMDINGSDVINIILYCIK